MTRMAPLPGLAFLACASLACARGVTPYLPLSIEPEMERQIERVLALGDTPVMKRPIAAALVLDALPRACAIDRPLCLSVQRYIGRYVRDAGITHASIEGAATDADSDAATLAPVPNRHGLAVGSEWFASATAFWQPSDYALVTLGGVSYDGDSSPNGSLVSVGFDRVQLDLGWRGHWLSPLTDSSMLLSTQAQTMPSVTLSNYVPLTRLGLYYEAFVAEMADSDLVVVDGATTSGHPQLFGLHVSAEPARGWSVGATRLMQYSDDKSFTDMLDAFVNPSGVDNVSSVTDPQFGNQVASLTSRFLFPGRTPFAVYFEYAGEDTSRGRNYLLGNAALSAGIHFPRLLRRVELAYEASEWQNGWYVHPLFGDGLANDRRVLGHWGANARQTGDAVGAQTHMVRVGWQPPFGGSLELRYRTVRNEDYSAVPYERAEEITARYSRPLGPVVVGAEAYTGSDVFGEDFSRFAAFLRWSPEAAALAASLDDGTVPVLDHGAEIFVDVGINANEVDIDLEDAIAPTTTDIETAPHFAIGARRAVGARNDLGARIEVDEIDGHTLIGVRGLDYRYRFRGPFAFTGFVGAARYDLATPAYGVYFGIGGQWRDVVPGWDIGLDLRYASKVARDNLLPTDPVGPRGDSFYDIGSATLYLTRRF
jgi:hypothetical protein